MLTAPFSADTNIILAADTLNCRGAKALQLPQAQGRTEQPVRLAIGATLGTWLVSRDS